MAFLFKNILSVRKFRVVAVLAFLALGENALGQDNDNVPSSLPPDSLSQEENDNALYQIELLRFERWAIANTEELTDPLLLKEVVRLKKEAETFAENQDFNLALIWMETIWDLLEPTRSSNLASPDDLNLDAVIDEVLLSPPAKFRWSRELSTGIDVWRQEFQFTFFEGDSTFLDGSGNPYSGVRTTFEYTPNSRRSIQALTNFKYSRDYLAGDLEIRFRNPLGQSSMWRLENRFEGSSFYRDFDVKYLQNRSTLAFDLRRLGPFSLDLKEEFLLRNYADSNNSYPNYHGNMINGIVKLHTNPGSYLGVGYRNIVRLHPDFGVNDYIENRFEFSWYQTFGKELSFNFENDLQFRDYTDAPTDTIFQDFVEDYFRGQVKIPFTSSLGAEIESSITYRDYGILSVSFPDHLLWEIEPRLYVKIGSLLQIAAGGYYSALNNQNREPATSATDATSILFEDYYMYGPTLLLDFFQINGIIFNVQQSFLWQRYPNSRRSNTNLALYADRQIYSILLFLTWNISPRWRLTVLANMDDDHSRHQESSDSNNTLIGLELNYSF